MSSAAIRKVRPGDYKRIKVSAMLMGGVTQVIRVKCLTDPRREDRRPVRVKLAHTHTYGFGLLIAPDILWTGARTSHTVDKPL